jgi:hypothetical protein
MSGVRCSAMVAKPKRRQQICSGYSHRATTRLYRTRPSTVSCRVMGRQRVDQSALIKANRFDLSSHVGHSCQPNALQSRRARDAHCRPGFARRRGLPNLTPWATSPDGSARADLRSGRSMLVMSLRRVTRTFWRSMLQMRHRACGGRLSGTLPRQTAAAGRRWPELHLPRSSPLRGPGR